MPHARPRAPRAPHAPRPTRNSHARAQILESQAELLFHLQQQRLIELIRAGRTEDALGFAAEFLAPQGEESPAFLEELGGWRGRWCGAGLRV